MTAYWLRASHSTKTLFSPITFNNHKTTRGGGCEICDNDKKLLYTVPGTFGMAELIVYADHVCELLHCQFLSLTVIHLESINTTVDDDDDD